ncbi:hypothetical protein D3C71_1034180 [compost metagenome]
MSSEGMPHTRSRVSARSAVWLQITSGTYRSSESTQLRRSTLALAPSRCRSSSAARVFSTSATTSRGRILSARGWVRSTSAAAEVSRAMSASICRSISGRSTLTTTWRPSARVAACTWAIEAEASGCRSKLANASLTGRPSACSTMRWAVSPSNGLTRSCSRVSSLATSAGIRSRRVDRICPNLTKIGPRSCSARRRRAPRDCAAISAEARGTNGLASRSQRSSGVPCSRSSSR